MIYQLPGNNEYFFSVSLQSLEFFALHLSDSSPLSDTTLLNVLLEPDGLYCEMRIAHDAIGLDELGNGLLLGRHVAEEARSLHNILMTAGRSTTARSGAAGAER